MMHSRTSYYGEIMTFTKHQPVIVSMAHSKRKAPGIVIRKNKWSYRVRYLMPDNSIVLDTFSLRLSGQYLGGGDRTLSLS